MKKETESIIYKALEAKSDAIETIGEELNKHWNKWKKLRKNQLKNKTALGTRLIFIGQGETHLI